MKKEEEKDKEEQNDGIAGEKSENNEIDKKENLQMKNPDNNSREELPQNEDMKKVNNIETDEKGTETPETEKKESKTDNTEETGIPEGKEKRREFKITISDFEEEASADSEMNKQDKPEDLASGQETDTSSEAENTVSKDEEQEEQQEEDEKKLKNKGCLTAAIYAVVILCISIIISVFAVSNVSDMFGFGKADKYINVTIPSGYNTQKIAEELKKADIIKHPLTFRIYAKLTHVNDLQYGTYTLNSNMSYNDIVEVLRNSGNNKSAIKVTIPEGYTIRQIAETLEKKKVCTKNEFLDTVKNRDFDFKLFSIKKDKSVFYKYEGLLFPDTYTFLKGQSADSIAQRMLDNFTLKFSSDMIKRCSAIHMTPQQVLTLASIIQAEAGKEAEMSYVSSVFHNRLEKGTGSITSLQSDATIFYIRYNITNYVTKDEAQTYTAYNTYKNAGLTPGPICNPGIAAIKAALYPAKTDYYYFVSDSSGTYYYAKTYADHLINVRKAIKNGSSAKGTDVK